jgi:ATP-dependent DNA ligase
MTPSNEPSEAITQELEVRSDPALQDFWASLDHPNDRYVDRCLAEGKDWRIRAAFHQRIAAAPIRACTYPARPINGGSMERALPKTGQWRYEPKYNGWRALVHAPSGSMFNRHGERLTIEREFAAALALLKAVQITVGADVVEWFDCEALDRCHGLGRGTLIVFDFIVPGSQEPYVERTAKLAQSLPVHEYTAAPQAARAYAVAAAAPSNLSALEFYRTLKQLNHQWKCPFYEGLVAKRADSLYPVQLRSPTLEFAGWVKHRWAGSRAR